MNLWKFSDQTRRSLREASMFALRKPVRVRETQAKPSSFRKLINPVHGSGHPMCMLPPGPEKMLKGFTGTPCGPSAPGRSCSASRRWPSIHDVEPLTKGRVPHGMERSTGRRQRPVPSRPATSKARSRLPNVQWRRSSRRPREL